jgi:hypothetical protein
MGFLGQTPLGNGLLGYTKAEAWIAAGSGSAYGSFLATAFGNTTNIITHIQDASGYSSSVSTLAVSAASVTTAGNFLLATICLPPPATVTSIIDSQGNPWIRAGNTGYTASSNYSNEIWYARGIAGGALTASVTTSTSFGMSVNISCWSGVWFVDPLDTWSQTSGTVPATWQGGPSVSAVTTNYIKPRQSGDLIVSLFSGGDPIGGGGGSVNAIPAGYTNLAQPGDVGYKAAYIIASSAASVAPVWSIVNGYQPGWAITTMALRPGAPGLNPRLQFPEILTQMSSTQNYILPTTNNGTWTNFSSYVQSLNIGPMGRQHELARVQSTPMNMTLNNRDGTFNTWNANSFLYNNGYGLKVMNPVQVTAAWQGVTYPRYYGYLQSLTNSIQDVLNVTAHMSCQDIFQMFALKYLTSNYYDESVIDLLSPQAYYTLSDSAHTYSVSDDSNNGNVGSLIPGPAGTPAFGVLGPFLYDSNTALDLTNGTNVPNGGFITNDNSTQPPTTHNPGNVSYPGVELWFKWTGSSASIPAVGGAGNAVLFRTDTSSGTREFQIGAVKSANNTGSLSNCLIITNGTSVTTYWEIFNNMFDGNWHQFFYRYPGYPGGNQIGIDGVLYSSSYVGGTIAPTLGGFLNMVFGSPGLGARGLDPDVGSRYSVAFTGSMSNVTIYSGAWGTNYPYTPTDHYNIGTWFRSIEYGAVSGGVGNGRLNKVLEVLGLDPSVNLSVPYPFQTLLFGETNPVSTTSGLNYIQTLEATEPGVIFQGPDGKVNAFNRQYQYLNPTSTTSQVTMSDLINSTNFYEGQALVITGDDLDTWNDVQVQSGRPGAALQEWGPAQSTAAATSASVNGPRTLQGLTSLKQQNDIDALSLAQNYAKWHNNPINRVAQVILNSYVGGGLNIPQQLQRTLMDRITVQYKGQTPSTLFSQQALIESITDTIVIDGGPYWKTTWALDPYEILMTPTILGSYVFGSGNGVLTL